MSETYFVECGIGNEWLISTEIEYPDGTEQRVPGVVWPFRAQSLYMRIWIGYVVIGVRFGTVNVKPKRRWAFKVLVGIEGVSVGTKET